MESLSGSGAIAVLTTSSNNSYSASLIVSSRQLRVTIAKLHFVQIERIVQILTIQDKRPNWLPLPFVPMTVPQCPQPRCERGHIPRDLIVLQWRDHTAPCRRLERGMQNMKPRFRRRFAVGRRASPGSTLELLLDLLLLAFVRRRRTKQAAFARDDDATRRLSASGSMAAFDQSRRSDPTSQCQSRGMRDRFIAGSSSRRRAVRSPARECRASTATGPAA